MKKLAKDRKIPHQMEVLPFGGTDAAGMQMAREGKAAITLSIPTRYLHSVVEAAHPVDIQATVDLLAAYLETAADHDLGL
jgi:endoglucanase